MTIGLQHCDINPNHPKWGLPVEITILSLTIVISAVTEKQHTDVVQVVVICLASTV